MKNKKDKNSSYDFDVVIIGAGMGGLTAGNILLKKGYKVLIVEKQATPGGYCTNFKQKDNTFDACIHMVNGCRLKGMIYEILKQFNAEDYYDGSTYLRLPASLQYFNSSLSPGVHNITIVLYGNYNINGVRDSTLFVQTYSS